MLFGADVVLTAGTRDWKNHRLSWRGPIGARKRARDSPRAKKSGGAGSCPEPIRCQPRHHDCTSNMSRWAGRLAALATFFSPVEMPELPDVEVYCAALRRCVQGHMLRRAEVVSPFLLRSFDPPLMSVEGRRVVGVRRLGKRIALGLEEDLHLVLHLMIAGRFRWQAAGARAGRLPRKIALATFAFDSGTLALTEPAKKKRAALHVVAGEAGLAAMRPRGLEPLEADAAAFAAAVTRERHTLKRTLTDPRLISGIGNAFSDEILHAARLSPLALTTRLTPEEMARLYEATRGVLMGWTRRLLADFAERFPGPGDITAFRPDFAAHGKFGRPCPACGVKIQRIRYAENETNYCPRCQTGDRVLADRSLSRLLKEDWPRTVEELEGGGR